MLPESLQSLPVPAALEAWDPQAIVDGSLVLGELLLWVAPGKIVSVCQELRDNLGFERICAVTAIDRYPVGTAVRGSLLRALDLAQSAAEAESGVARHESGRGKRDCGLARGKLAPHGPQHGAAAPVHARRAAPAAGTGRRNHRPRRDEPDIGFLHTGIEKEFEVKNYQQAVTLTDRVDYLAPLSNNLGYCLAVEKLLGLEIPPQAQWMRVMLVELTRLNSHLVWLGTHAIDIGAMTVFLYCFREREDILRIFEMFSGQRMMTSYFRIGGLALEPPRGWQQRASRSSSTLFPSRIDEYETCSPTTASGLAAPRASASFRSKTCWTWASPGPCCAPPG
jgi:hypothetical protein